ncbi:MAG: hypothetical protein LUG98_15515, partial [Tannerellaceae bacterium]|nr:hypothetical protein [Tannerellaceae bacterium]
MKDILNSNFVKRIQEFLPDQVTLVSCVMEILGIGREAAYRRLRNEVPFTFYEVSLIAHRLGISLDQIIGNYESKTGIFNLNLVHLDEALRHYCATLQRFKEYLSFMKGDDSASISMVSNSVPYLLYLPFYHIMKFRLCHWLHQTDKFKPVGSLDKITIPEPVANLQRAIYEGIQEVRNTYMIWDIHLFASFIKEIDYFSKLNYINKNDV